MTLDGEQITLDRLIKGRDKLECTWLISKLDPVLIKHLIHILAHERLMRKRNDIIKTLKATSNNWQLTMLIYLLRFLCGQHNKVAAERLARIVTHRTIMRERESLMRLEALLLGSAGLLDLYEEDDYILELKREFDHMAAKYSIRPMLPGEWQLTGFYPNSHPTLRLAQLAASYHYETFAPHSILLSLRRKDIHKLFSGQASEYWVRNFIPKNHDCSASRRIGSFTSDILGINFVAQVAFAYGEYIQSNELIEHAIDLLEEIPSEKNRYTKLWNHHATITHSAYDSQAIIQLSKEYCDRARCEKCPFARMLINFDNAL